MMSGASELAPGTASGGTGASVPVLGVKSWHPDWTYSGTMGWFAGTSYVDRLVLTPTDPKAFV